jgi:hypothetical protein
VPSGDSIKATHYRDRAESFLRAMHLLSDEGYVGAEIARFLPAAALLAVHAGIALCDAILVLKTGDRSKAQDHREAVAKLRDVCGRNRIDAAGTSHLSQLVAEKDYFAYGDRHVTATDIKSAVVQADRFADWVYRSFPELAIEESNDPS